jgi:energy-coupling factor transporter ATP-binding protein EcfA2
MNKLPTAEVPKPVAEPGQGIRQTVTNSLTKELGLRVDEYVGKEKFYDKETLSEWWDVAANKIKVGGENQSLTRLLNTDQFDKYDVTEGRILLRDLREQGGRESDITALAQKMATQGTEMARGLASWRNFDVLQNPEMIAAKIFNEAKKHLGNKAPKLTPEQVKTLGDMAREANKLQGRQRVIGEAKIYAYIRSQVPKSIWKKISTVQAIHQLLNAKTVIRNIVGNTGLEAMEIVSHYAGMPGDYLLSKFTGNRSVTVPRTIKHIGDLARTFKTSIVDIKDGINTSKSSIEQQTGMKIAGELENMFEFNAGETFKGNTFYGKLEKLVGYTMQAPDRAFFEARFWDSVDNMMRATKTKAITPEIMTQALQEASNVTFRDMNNISKGLVALKKGLNKFTAGTMHGEFGFGDLALKYPKVPGAIIKRGIEYSPFGLLGSVLKPFKLAYKGIKGQDVSAIEQRQAVLASARGVVGTVLAGLGYALAKSDDVTGKRPDNPKLAAFEDAIGKRPYSFKKKNSIISYDWLQPAAMPFTMGVDLATKKELEQKGEGVFQQIVNFITDTGAAAGSSIAEQPVMTGISRLASGEKYGNEGGIMGGLLSSAAAAPSSFVPTLFAQVASTIDPVKKVIPKNFSGRMLALFVNRIPVLSKTLDTRKSVLGEDIKKGTGDTVTDLILNLVSPTIYSKLKDDPNVNLISQLYADTKDTDVLPVTPGASKTGIITYKNQIYELTPKQKLELQESTAKLALDRLTLIGRGININKMSLESKVKFMRRIYNYAGEVARKKMIANVISEKIKKGKK